MKNNSKPSNHTTKQTDLQPVIDFATYVKISDFIAFATFDVFLLFHHTCSNAICVRRSFLSKMWIKHNWHEDIVAMSHSVMKTKNH